MASTKLCKLKCNGRQYYLSATDEAGPIDLVLTDTVKAWQGRVSQEELRTGNMDLDDCEAQSRTALTGNDMNSFEYELKEEANGTGSVRLIWKKVVEQDHIKFQLGSVIMEPVAELSTAISSVLDHIIQSTADLRQQVAQLKSDRERLANEHDEALQELGDSVGIKEKTEEELFAKFVIVLNDKKAKIRHLKAELEAAQTGGIVSRASTQSASVVAQKVKDKASRERRVSTDTFGCSTDEEMDRHDDNKHASCTTVTSAKAAEDERRNRKEAADSSLDLMLDDSTGDADEVPVVSKRAGGTRKRQTSEREASPDWQPVPLMLSMTGTTNTATTSSLGQRFRDKSGAKMEVASTSPKHNSVSRTAEIDDLIGDMA